jgi:hypothetical protein
MNKIIYILCSVVFLQISCKNEKMKKGEKKISLTDPSNVITETDSSYLGNIVADITKNNTTNTKQEVTNVIAKVDSVKEAKTIAAAETNDVSGTNIECKECKVTFSTLMNQNGDHYTVPNMAALIATKIQVNGLIEPQIEQRFFTKLKIEINKENYVLEELLENANAWQKLPANGNVFSSTAQVNATFRNVDNKAILLATDRAMRKIGKGRKELEDMKKTIANTNTYSDAPCKVFITAIHYKISGKKNGKKVNETIKVSL